MGPKKKGAAGPSNDASRNKSTGHKKGPRIAQSDKDDIKPFGPAPKKKVLRNTGPIIKLTGGDIKNVSEKYRDGILAACNSAQEEFPELEKAEFRGTKEHSSSQDPEETQSIVSLRLYGKNNEYIATLHARSDGSGKVKTKDGTFVELKK